MAVRKRKRRRTKNYPWRVILSLSALVLLLTVFFILDWNNRFELKVKRYREFGIDMPVEYPIHGIDVSRYQKMIAWEEVKNMRVDDIQIGFAFIKATEGENDTDPNFKRNWRLSAKNQVTRGAYHFFIPYKDPGKQAMNFIKKVSLKPGDLPPVLDVEQTNNLPAAIIQSKTKLWLQIIENHYHIKPIIYTNADFYKKCLGEGFDEYPLWVAHYYEKKKPRINRKWTIWQHNDGGLVNGIEAKVDYNVFNGDSAAFKALLLQ